MSHQKYLIDTDIIIDYFKGRYSLNKKINAIDSENCFVSEITIAELKFGALKSKDVDKQKKNVEKLQSKFRVIPISRIIDAYAKERLRLESIGKRIQDFDLLIAVTSVEGKHDIGYGK